MKTLLITALFMTGMVFIPINLSASCSSQHSCGGCSINFTQSSTDWSYTLDCGGGIQSYSGDGDYQGTFCGGEEPCSVPQEN